MLSKLGEKIEELNRIIHANDVDPQQLMKLIEEIQEMQLPFYDEFDFLILNTYADALTRLAATNMLASATKASENTSGLPTFQLLLELHPLLNNNVAQALMTFSMKQAIILFQAEQRAKKLASEALGNWVVTPEPSQELPPNQDPPVQPPDELPTTS